jgi:hypothetical protein
MQSVLKAEKIRVVFLKTHRIFKDGKAHIYYSLCESLRVSRKRVLQRQVLHLGELNTTQLERWQRTIEVVQEDGRRHQMRLFSDRHTEVTATAAPENVAEVLLSSLVVRRPRQFGACWVGCKLWEELELGEFWHKVLGEETGAVPWDKVAELLTVNRLIAPRSELSIHEKWFAQTAMAALLDSDERVAEKDRLYRALDRIVEHKEALEVHLAGRWKDLFGASFDVLLYDLTSTQSQERFVAPRRRLQRYPTRLKKPARRASVHFCGGSLPWSHVLSVMQLTPSFVAVWRSESLVSLVYRVNAWRTSSVLIAGV